VTNDYWSPWFGVRLMLALILEYYLFLKILEDNFEGRVSNLILETVGPADMPLLSEFDLVGVAHCGGVWVGLGGVMPLLRGEGENLPLSSDDQDDPLVGGTS